METNGISIIGTGALGTTLAASLQRAGYRIQGLYNRSEKKLDKVSKSISSNILSSFPENIDELGDLTFLTVPDQQIQPVARRLAALPGDTAATVFVHCSGNRTSHLLSILHRAGALTASFHPLQTFTAFSRAEDFEGIYIDMEGDAEALQVLEPITHDLGAKPMVIDREAKPYLHAAAVMASNNMVALISAATKIAAEGGLDPDKARRALMPLVLQSVENIDRAGSLNDALSGPVARGDADTVRKHLNVLEGHPRLQGLYSRLGAILAEIAGEGGRLTDRQLAALNELLEGREE